MQQENIKIICFKSNLQSSIIRGWAFERNGYSERNYMDRQILNCVENTLKVLKYFFFFVFKINAKAVYIYVHTCTY